MEYNHLPGAYRKTVPSNFRIGRYSLRMLMARATRIRHIPSNAQLRIAADFWYGLERYAASRNESMLNEHREREH